MFTNSRITRTSGLVLCRSIRMLWYNKNIVGGYIELVTLAMFVDMVNSFAHNNIKNKL